MSHTIARQCASRVSHVQENSEYHHGAEWIPSAEGGFASHICHEHADEDCQGPANMSVRADLHSALFVLNTGQNPANCLVHPRAQALRHGVTITWSIDFTRIDSSPMSRNPICQEEPLENWPILTRLVALYFRRSSAPPMKPEIFRPLYPDNGFSRGSTSHCGSFLSCIHLIPLPLRRKYM